MLRKPTGLELGGSAGLDETPGSKTFGHALLTTEMITKLANFASHWAVVIHFENVDESPNHALFPASGLISIFEQGRLCRASLLAGFRTSKAPRRPVPATFFRTLDFLLQYIAAGNNYRPITDKEEAKGFPPAGWCRPPVVASPDDAAAATEAALRGATPEALIRFPATDPIRLFYSSRSWCLVTAFHISASTVKVDIGKSPEEMYELYLDGRISEYAAVLGLQEPNPPSNLWVPPCIMTPLGAVLYMHNHGRPYLPLSLAELREIRSGGVTAVGERKEARPLALPPDVWPQGLQIPGMDASPTGSGRGDAEGGRVDGTGRGLRGSTADGSRQAGRTPSAPPPAAAGPSESGRSGGGGSGGGRGGMAPSSSFSSLSSAARADGGPSNSAGGGGASGADASASRPVPEPEPDPILNSANWIMPRPFDTPIPPPPVATAADGAPADATDLSGGGEAAMVVTAAAAALPPSAFLGDLNRGVQATFETPPVQLFLGHRGQIGLSANWWFVDSDTGSVQGPYSPEQMMLSYVAGCRELHEETLVCGTETDIRQPMLPPKAAFLPLGTLLHAVNDGSTYALVTRADIVSPLAHRLLSNRIRAPKPAAPSPTPVAAVAVPQQPTAAPMGAGAVPAVQPAAVVTVPVVSAVPTAVPVAAVPVVVAVQASMQQPAQTTTTPAQPPPTAPVSVAPIPAAPAQSVPLPSQPGQQAAEAAAASAPPSVPQQEQQQAPQAQPPPHQHPPPPPPPPPVGMHASAFRPPMGVPVMRMMNQPRPVMVAAMMPAPTYVLPGAAMYMPQYGQGVPHPGHQMMAQPVLRGPLMGPSGPRPYQQPR